MKRILLTLLICSTAAAGPTIVESGGFTFLPALKLTGTQGLVATQSGALLGGTPPSLNQVGLVAGNISGFGAICTPSASGYSLNNCWIFSQGLDTFLNAPTGSNVIVRINNATKATFGTSALLLPSGVDLQTTQGQKLTFDGATAAKYLSSDGTTLTLTGLNCTAPKLTSTTASGSDSVVITKGARLQLNAADDPNNNTISSSSNGVITFGAGATEIDASQGQMNLRNVGLTAWFIDSFSNDGAAAKAFILRTQNTYVPATNPNARVLEIQNPSGTAKIGWDGNGKENYPTGGAASVVGRSALTTGTVTVSTTAVTASSVIQLTRCVAGGTVGVLQVGTVTAGTSFVINSVQPGTASTIQAADTATVCWSFVN